MDKYSRLIMTIILAAVLLGNQPAAGSYDSPRAVIQPPQLIWQNGGCYSSWCETGWYASPAAADLDGDGLAEVIGAAYSVFILDGATGKLKGRLDPPGSRIWPGVVLGDIQGDGKPEIVVAQGGGYLTAYDGQGNEIWSRQPTPGNELRSLAASDLDQDGNLELIVASTRSEDQWTVYEADGSLRPGQWPQHGPDSDTNGYAAGCFNENVAAGDIDGDGLGEIIGPNDTHYIAAFNDDGSQMPANTIFGTNPDGSPRFWSRIGVHVDQAVDIRGYAHCGVEHRPNFANSAPVLADVNQDGVLETIVVGNVYNCGTDPYTDLYEIPYILNVDRTRWKSGPYDWTVLPSPDAHAAPLSEDYNRIENNVPNPVAVDLDGDGQLEILYPSYDGRMHAYWLDKTEHGNWPFAVTTSGDGGLSFASEPVVADLDNNGKAEVIFTSWVEKGSNRSGKLYILDDLGNALQVVDLPPAYGGGDWNGAMAAPTLANLNADADLELVVNTAASGFAAYTLPGSAGARVLWGTGRQDQLRAGLLKIGNLSESRFFGQQQIAASGEGVDYTIQLENDGSPLTLTSASIKLPPELTLDGPVQASSGAITPEDNGFSWHGSVPTAGSVRISYRVRVSTAISGRPTLTSTLELNDGLGHLEERGSSIIVNGFGLYLPRVGR